MNRFFIFFALDLSSLVSRRPVDPGFGFPRVVHGWRLDVRVGATVGGRDEGVRVQGIAGRN